VSIVAREEALQKAAKKLDISPSKYKQAMNRYETMRDYLMVGDYPGAAGEPEIYLQGSFKLGTEIRPYKDSKEADYDIDIVCRLEHQKGSTTPVTVKHQVGDHIKAHSTYEKMLDDEGKRCWTLNYAEQDEIGFHMDVLPSVKESWHYFREFYWIGNAIAVTNKSSDTGEYSWSPSNPKDFSEWFYSKNKAAFDNVKLTQKQVVFESYRQDGLFSNSDAVPDIHVKTPLQRVIQLLKRHRDIRFSGQDYEKYKPISIVITVLAGQIYANESTIYDTLSNIINTLSRHANQMQSTFRFDESTARADYGLITRTADGEWHIANPTNPGENFADKWHEDDHARAKAFFQWVAWVKEDMVNIAERLDEDYFVKSLVSPSQGSGLTAVSAGSSMFDVSHRQSPLWPLSLVYSIQILGKFRASGSWQRFNSGDLLRKSYDLLFSVNTNVSPPFDVYWQVVNTGKEANDKGQLRGQIVLSRTAGIGGLTQKESTSYTGNHWVECFIVQNSVCVARSGEFIVSVA